MKNLQKKALRTNERLACRVLSNLKYRGESFYKCLWNDILLSIAFVFLKGRDPVEFLCWIFDAEDDSYTKGNILGLRKRR